MNWTHLTISVPAGADFEIGALLFGLVMLCVNVGLLVAMRYERRVR